VLPQKKELSSATILGENVAGRVRPFGDATGSRTLGFGSTQEGWDALSPAQRWRLNDGQLGARINEGDIFRYPRLLREGRFEAFQSEVRAEETQGASDRLVAVGGVAVPLRVPSLSLVPVTPVLRDATAGPAGEVLVPGFYELREGLAGWASNLSRSGRVGYVHLEFHGGTGFHAAMGWSDGSIGWGPAFTTNDPGDDEYRIMARGDRQGWAANELLRWLGVQAEGPLDEFDVAGLGQHRWTAEWLPSEGG
jgi:hypothetical protein